MTALKDMEIKTLKESLERARTQRDQYGTSYKKLHKEYKKLEEKCEILVSHNLIHMRQKVELQDYILSIETNAFLSKLDRTNLLKW